MSEQEWPVICDYCNGTCEPFDGVACTECVDGKQLVAVEPITLADLDRDIPPQGDCLQGRNMKQTAP